MTTAALPRTGGRCVLTGYSSPPTVARDERNPGAEAPGPHRREPAALTLQPECESGGGAVVEETMTGRQIQRPGLCAMGAVREEKT